MKEYLLALSLAALPAAGNFLGGVLAELVQVSKRTLSFALHAAAGILIAVIAVELVPEAMHGMPAWAAILCFVAGGLFFLAVDAVIGITRKRLGAAGDSAGPWAIFFGVSVDLFTDGVMIGAGSTLSLGLGLLLALGQVPADVPEGFATLASFRSTGSSRRRRLLFSAAFAIPIFLGTTIGYWAVRGQPEAVKLALLAFAAGILMTVTVEEIIPQAHEQEDSRGATLCLIGGFALFSLIASYLG